jgi:xylan 1,4-beta-xylosidase
MKSDVTLKLDDECIFISPVNKEDFVPLEFDKESNYLRENSAIISAWHCRNICITGGKIIGKGAEFWYPREEGQERPHQKEFRPKALLFYDCDNVTVKNLLTEDAPVYTAWILDCKNVAFIDCEVSNDLLGPNTDGYHFSSCSDVLVDGCKFKTGDDAVAVDGNNSGLSKGTEIRNCTFNTSCNALRVYTGLDPNMIDEKRYSCVRDIKMHDCKITDAVGVMNVIAQHGDIKNIEYSNLDIETQRDGTPLFFMTDNGTVEDITIKNITASSNGIGVIIGTETHFIKNITLEDMRAQVTPRNKKYALEIPDPIPAYHHQKYSPCNLYIRHAEGISIRNLSVAWRKSEEYNYDISTVYLKDVKKLTMENISTASNDNTF